VYTKNKTPSVSYMPFGKIFWVLSSPTLYSTQFLPCGLPGGWYWNLDQ